MRFNFLLLPLIVCATPALAQAPVADPALQMPPEFTDPATAEKLANAMQALSKALLDLPVGDVQAALEGRKPTSAEKKLTVREMGRRDNPNFERELNRQIAQSKPMIEHSMKALAAAMPAIMKSMSEAGAAIERASTNLPDPTYPKR